MDLTPLIRFAARKLQPGSYVYSIRLKAAMNPGRVSVFASKPFRVGGAVKPKRKGGKVAKRSAAKTRTARKNAKK